MKIYDEFRILAATIAYLEIWHNDIVIVNAHLTENLYSETCVIISDLLEDRPYGIWSSVMYDLYGSTSEADNNGYAVFCETFPYRVHNMYAKPNI